MPGKKMVKADELDAMLDLMKIRKVKPVLPPNHTVRLR
jgi:hypothetical protein